MTSFFNCTINYNLTLCICSESGNWEILPNPTGKKISNFTILILYNESLVLYNESVRGFRPHIPKSTILHKQ